MKRILLLLPLIAFSCGKFKSKVVTFRNNTGVDLMIESVDLGISRQIKDKDYRYYDVVSGEYTYNVISTDSTVNYYDVVVVKKDDITIELHK